MMTEHFKMFAAYNRWANARLYAGVLALSEDTYRRPAGLFFGSLHGTLNHLLLTDRLWLKRLTGSGEHPDQLNATLFEDRRELARARIVEDERFIELVNDYDDTAMQSQFNYRTTSGAPQQQRLSHSLSHIFNHQTHHRGQAHAGLSIVTGREPESLDLLIFQRGGPAPDVAKMLV